MPNMELYTTNDWNGNAIRIRKSDRYVSLTDMAKASGKRVNNWTQTTPAQEFLQALESITGIPVMDLIQSKVGGSPEDTGTWAHPKAAIHFAQWCSPQFAVQVSFWIDELMNTGTVTLIPQPERVMPKYTAVEYIDAAYRLEKVGSPMLKKLLENRLIEEIDLESNLLYLPVAEKPKKYTIATVRASQLGYSPQQIGDGCQLGKWVKKHLEPAFEEQVGRFAVKHYEITDDLDNVIHRYFSR